MSLHNTCPYCTEAREHKRWITYARGCPGCASRLVAASFKALVRTGATKAERLRLATRLANVAQVPLDDVRGWM